MGKLATLAFASKAAGFAVQMNDFWLRKMLEGWSREVGIRKDVREPLSPLLLKGLKYQWAALCLHVFEDVLFHAAALVAFFGTFRVNDLVAS